MSRIALYYPFIHFQDEAWLKLAALYWARIARIVPKGFELHDSPIVKQLNDELGFVQELDPTPAATRIAPRFAELLKQHGPALRERYDPSGLQERYDQVRWTTNLGVELSDHVIDAITDASSQQARWATNLGVELPGHLSDRIEYRPELEHIATGKIEPEVVDAMLETGLVIRSPKAWGGSEWLSIHPRLAAVYLTALAEDLAAANKLEPLTDRAIDHVAVSGWTMPRLAQALLEDTPLVGSKRSTMEIPDQLGMIAIQAVIPRNLTNLPVKKIIQIRTRYGDELASLRTHLDALSTSLESLRLLEDPTILQVHLETIYQDTLRKDMKRLERDLKALGIDTVTAAMKLRVAPSDRGDEPGRACPCPSTSSAGHRRWRRHCLRPRGGLPGQATPSTGTS